MWYLPYSSLYLLYSSTCHFEMSWFSMVDGQIVPSGFGFTSAIKSWQVLRFTFWCMLCHWAKLLLGCIGGSELWIPLDTCDLEYLDWICSGHVYNDDEKGTKLVMTRVRPSFVQRLLWSNAAADDLVVQASDPQIPQQESEPCTSIASNAPWRAQFFGGVGIKTFSVHWMSLVQLWVGADFVSFPCLFLLEPWGHLSKISWRHLMLANWPRKESQLREALASYKAKVRLRTAVGFFRFFALWVFLAVNPVYFYFTLLTISGG